MQYIQCLAQVALSKSDVSSCYTLVARGTIPKGGTHWTTSVNWIPGLGLCGKEKHLEGHLLIRRQEGSLPFRFVVSAFRD